MAGSKFFRSLGALGERSENRVGDNPTGRRTYGDAQQYLRVQVAHLRRKIEADVVRPRYIVTEPGVGYRFNIVERTSP